MLEYIQENEIGTGCWYGYRKYRVTGCWYRYRKMAKVQEVGMRTGKGRVTICSVGMG